MGQLSQSGCVELWYNLYMGSTKINTPKRILRPLLLVGLSLLMLVPTIGTAGAQTVQELQNKSQQLQEDIDANNSKITDLNRKAQTLGEKVEQLNLEVTLAEREIELTEVRLRELRQRLAEAEAELERQRELLKAALRELYKSSNTTTLELLITSESFSEFISTQEYLDRLQDAVRTSMENVVELKQQIEDEKREQEELLTRQQQQKQVLAAKRGEQTRLLEETQGEESRYRTIVAEQHEQLEDAESQLARLLSSGNYVSLGPVKRGDIIGAVGSTGFSTGPHIHFQVYKDGVTQNPYLGGTQLVNGYTWPTPGNYVVTTPYGNIPCENYTGCNPPGSSYSVWHSGLDIRANTYDPIVAVADGDIVYKGCEGGLGYTVVVDHGNGWQSWYPHQVTPDGQIFGYC